LYAPESNPVPLREQALTRFGILFAVFGIEAFIPELFTSSEGQSLRQEHPHSPPYLLLKRDVACPKDKAGLKVICGLSTFVANGKVGREFSW
jgi:hypothetical protein